MYPFALTAISQDQYAAWFDQHRAMLYNRSPFHQPAYLNAVAKGMQIRVVFIGMYQENNLVGVLPGFVGRRGPFQLFGSPLRGTNTSYLGPMMLPSTNGRYNLRQLVEACSRFAQNKWGVKYTEFT